MHNMLIAIEGIDGSGKGTQALRLTQRLNAEGVSAALLSFPRYGETTFGRAIGEYLNGRFGSLPQVHPQLASLLFAGDRFESLAALNELRESHRAVVLDRYVSSNVAHQGARASAADRAALIEFIERVEFEVYGVPRPELTFLFDLPVADARRLIHQKSARSYTDQPADLHEADASYLESVREVYLDLARNRDDWQVVPVVCNGAVRPIEEIAEEIAAATLQRVAG